MNAGLIVLLVGASAIYLIWHRLLAYLRYFQQEGYDSLRFLRWVTFRSLTDPAVWLAVLCRIIAGAGVPLLQPDPAASGGVGSVVEQTVGLGVSVTSPPSGREIAAAALFILGAVALARLQPDPRRSGKITLKLTDRAKRVLRVALALAFVKLAVGQIPAMIILRSTILEPYLFLALVLAFLPLFLVMADVLLGPYERGVQHTFEMSARRKIRELKPHIIGITGSYGKSSAKAMLAHVLQTKAPTLAATGSINTPMGVTRHIREELLPGHRFMVVEMGAFKAGSIRRLCALTPPSAGLITAVGDMHLERFGSTEEIVRAKSELARAVPEGGLLVANADSPGALRIARGAKGRRVLLYGETSTEDLDARLARIHFTRKGTEFVLRTREREWTCFTPLMGRPIILNLVGVFTLASAVGVDPELIVASMRTLRPVSNRLEVVEENGITWIRDAYNSNQFGFRAALEVASALPAQHRYLVTPGVIELGAQQSDVNRTLSREAAASCDRTVVVADTNRAAFVAGHAEAGREDRLVTVPGRREAFAWLKEHVHAGDTVILENDLPDLLEKSTGLFWSAS